MTKKFKKESGANMVALLKTAHTLWKVFTLFPPVQEALWGKPRSTEASKRSAARLLREPLSYNTASFLFSCLNTFYKLSARTKTKQSRVKHQGRET